MTLVCFSARTGSVVNLKHRHFVMIENNTIVAAAQVVFSGNLPPLLEMKTPHPEMLSTLKRWLSFQHP